MIWQDIGIAVSLYNRRTPSFPLQPLNPIRGPEKRYMMTIQNLTAVEIKTFLNSWGQMRMSFDVNKIQQAIQNSQNHLNNLSRYNIETVTLNNINHDIIGLFNQFLDVGSKRSHVAASKIIHLLLPDLLFMWDNAIKTGYGCGSYRPLKGKTYAETYFEFLIRVQKKLLNMLSLYVNHFNLGNIAQGSIHFKNKLYQGGVKSLTKIIDEYNFQKFTQGSNQLW